MSAPCLTKASELPAKDTKPVRADKPVIDIHIYTLLHVPASIYTFTPTPAVHSPAE